MPVMTVSEMLAQPWNWQGPKHVADQDGTAHYEMRIAELPDFFVACRTRDEVFAELLPALEAYLHSFIDRGETVPRPVASGTWQFVLPQRPQTEVDKPVSASAYLPMGKVPA